VAAAERRLEAGEERAGCFNSAGQTATARLKVVDKMPILLFWKW
jgi:hypothetical protein